MSSIWADRQHLIGDIAKYPGDPSFRPYPDVKNRERPIPGFHRAPTNQQALVFSPTFGRKLYKSNVHPGFGRNDIDFGKIANSSRSGLCGTLRRSGPCHQSILSESNIKSEPKELAWSRDGIADNFDNQTLGRNPGKGRGFPDLGPKKCPNPTQSEIWRTLSLPIPRISIVPIVIRPK
jgi:hypothetical protein